MIAESAGPATRQTASTPAGLETRGATFALGPLKLVDDISIQAFPGEVMALAGPNGAGKSTLLRLMAHELEPTEGEVLLMGRPIESYAAKDLAKRRAVLPQQTVLQFAFTAHDVVMMGRNPHIEHGWPGPEDRAIAENAMQRTQTWEFRERIYPRLSGGEQSRVTLARVLAQDTPVLLLDEPTAALDVKHQELAMQTAQALAAEGACIVVIIHDLNLAAAYADRIALLNHARLVACGTPAEVLRGEVLTEVFETPLKVLNGVGGLPHPLVIPDRTI